MVVSISYHIPIGNFDWQPPRENGFKTKLKLGFPIDLKLVFLKNLSLFLGLVIKPIKGGNAFKEKTHHECISKIMSGRLQ